VLMAALLSPLVVYAGRPVVPFAALYGIAAGIALGLGLAGRRLHGALLQDALGGRGATARALLACGMALLLVLLVLLGAVIALLLLFRSVAPKVPV
jgi:hypothetical protein